MQEREHVRDHAVILPDDATPKPDGIFGKDNHGGGEAIHDFVSRLVMTS
jgi:hypothetical protein